MNVIQSRRGNTGQGAGFPSFFSVSPVVPLVRMCSSSSGVLRPDQTRPDQGLIQARFTPPRLSSQLLIFLLKLNVFGPATLFPPEKEAGREPTADHGTVTKTTNNATLSSQKSLCIYLLIHLERLYHFYFHYFYYFLHHHHLLSRSSTPGLLLLRRRRGAGGGAGGTWWWASSRRTDSPFVA